MDPPSAADQLAVTAGGHVWNQVLGIWVVMSGTTGQSPVRWLR